MNSTTARIAAEVARHMDAGGVLDGDAVEPRYGDDLSGEPSPLPQLVLRPRNTAEVAAILRLCQAAGQKLVVQGGRTGLSGGARVLEGEAVLSLERLTAVGRPDPDSATVVVEAGAPLQAVHDAAEAHGMIFGVDLGARGSATIGGMVATNAGGIRVLRYGMMRAQVLGLEAVLADGTVVSSLRGLAKDNSGPDLSQLLVGSEGVLGVVTRACLRLHPAPAARQVALCALPSLAAARALLGRMRAGCGARLSAFEIMVAPLYREMTAAFGHHRPVSADGGCHALVELESFAPQDDGCGLLSVLEHATAEGLVADAVIAQSQREHDALWHLREECSRFIFAQPSPAGFDIGLPQAAMDGFLEQAEALVRSHDPEGMLHAFGHLGDGNLHVIVVARNGHALAPELLALVAGLGGSISAEHGVGLLKKPYLGLVRSEGEIGAMRRLKAALDPAAILNRGRVFDVDPASSRRERQ